MLLFLLFSYYIFTLTDLHFLVNIYFVQQNNSTHAERISPTFCVGTLLNILT